MPNRRKKTDHHRRDTDETWMQAHWRPMMAWQYFTICMFDFLIAPIFFAWFSWVTKTTMMQWQPLTLQGGGLYHLAMGAIVGITSYARSQERITTSNNQFQNFQQPGQYQQPGQFNQFQQNTQTGFQPGPNMQPMSPQPVVNGQPPAVPPVKKPIIQNNNPDPEL